MKFDLQMLIRLIIDMLWVCCPCWTPLISKLRRKIHRVCDLWFLCHLRYEGLVILWSMKYESLVLSSRLSHTLCRRVYCLFCSSQRQSSINPCRNIPKILIDLLILAADNLYCLCAANRKRKLSKLTTSVD